MPSQNWDLFLTYCQQEYQHSYLRIHTQVHEPEGHWQEEPQLQEQPPDGTQSAEIMIEAGAGYSDTRL